MTSVAGKVRSRNAAMLMLMTKDVWTVAGYVKLMSVIVVKVMGTSNMN